MTIQTAYALFAATAILGNGTIALLITRDLIRARIERRAMRRQLDL